MDRDDAITLLDRLHAAQNAFYGGGDAGPLRELLDPEITWSVPGVSPIAGTYRGVDEVFAYFADRRDRAAGTFRMHRRDVLWSTVGLYDTAGDRDARRIVACWLLALDQRAFDAIWSR